MAPCTAVLVAESFAGARRCAVWWLDELYYKKAMMEGAGGAHSPLRVVLLSFVWTHVHP